MDSRNFTLFYGGPVITPDGAHYDDWAVMVEGSKIIAVGPYRYVKHYARDEKRIDVRGRTIAPGFIDLQLNGAAGRMLTSEPTVETVRAMAEILPRFGCTAFLPTVITAPVEQMQAAARAVATVMNDEPSHGARVLGTHLEGPFINPAKAGAHRPEFVIPPSVDMLRRLWEDGGESAVLLTLAPEMPGADALIAEAQRLGIAVAIGHSTADLAQVNEATRQGATLVTHLFNAMDPLGSRQPGTVGGALSNDEIAVSLIADGVHVHPASLKIAVRAKGAERVVLITDAMAPLGTEMRQFELLGEVIEVRDGACYRADGVLAGSVLSMDQAVRNICQLTGVTLPEAIAMASTNPARVIGQSHFTGSLEPGNDADIVVCDDEANVWLTMVQGQVCYRATEAR
jgi:N-acetylglucosamine-6-phosphate deacetylase